MTDHQFEVELRIRAYKDQIDGYILGWPEREDFHPLVPVIKDRNGKLDRQETLDLPSYHTFTEADKVELLNTEPCPHDR